MINNKTKDIKMKNVKYDAFFNKQNKIIEDAFATLDGALADLESFNNEHNLGVDVYTDTLGYHPDDVAEYVDTIQDAIKESA